MFYMAALLGVRISEVEAWPMSELREWSDYVRVKDLKPEQSAEQMMRAALTITSRYPRG